MELSKEYVLQVIETGIRKFGSIAEFERRAGLPNQKIKDIKRMKGVPNASDWNKILKSVSGNSDVPIIADVGAGARICPIDDLPLYRSGLSEQDKIYVNCETVEPPPGYSPSEVLAVRVKGDSMLPFMPSGTIAYYSNRHEPITGLIKKLCIVQTTTGEAYLKILKKGEKYGRFNLMSYNASEIEDVEIAWAARVIFVKMG